MKLCTLCVRGGSKGVPDKNIRLMFGRPLMEYTVRQAQESELFDQIVVSTDSPNIAETARTLGIDVWFLRPSELATDDMAKIPVIRHALCEAEMHYGHNFETIVDLDVTSPLRIVSDIKDAYAKFIDYDADNLFTVCRSRRNPYFNMVEIANGTVKLIKQTSEQVSRRQDAPEVFDINASIYIWKRDVLLNCNSLYNTKTSIHTMPESRSMDIDSEQDWRVVEYLMSENSSS